MSEGEVKAQLIINNKKMLVLYKSDWMIIDYESSEAERVRYVAELTELPIDCQLPLDSLHHFALTIVSN